MQLSRLIVHSWGGDEGPAAVQGRAAALAAAIAVQLTRLCVLELPCSWDGQGDAATLVLPVLARRQLTVCTWAARHA